jgi:porin
MAKSMLGWVPVLLRLGALPGLAFGAMALGTPTPARAQTDGNLWTLGNMGGLRTVMGQYGVSLSVDDTESLLANVSGGVQQGATMQGVTTATLQVDTAKAFGLQGGTFNVSALQIHGRSLSPFYLDNLQTANGTEAEDATRLWELWYDQAFDQSHVDIKLGQQSIDQEFIVSKYSGLFVNTMAGWPLVPSSDLYGGGPAYPLSSLGVRVQFKPTDNIAVLAGVFDDNPAGGPFADDPQSGDAGGTRFNLNTGALFIAEFQYSINQPSAGGTAQSGAGGSGLPGTYKLGFWYDTGSFPDQAIDNNGLSLANPASDGDPLIHHGNFSIYGVMDQTVWVQSPSGARSLNVFARLMGAPVAQNLISFSANGGVTLTDPLPGRDKDTAGIDLGIGHVSGQVADLNEATAFFSGMPTPVRGTETLIELTYQAQITPWLQIQPDAQFVFNPGGGIEDPNDPSHLLSNEVVVGVRSNIIF